MIASIQGTGIGSVLLALSLWTACGSDRAPGVDTHLGGSAGKSNASGATAGKGGSAQGASSGHTSPGGSAGEEAGGAASQGGSDGGAIDPGSIGGAGAETARGGGVTTVAGGAAESPIVVCPLELRVGQSQRVDVSSPASELFGAITPDELVIAWTTVDAELVQLHSAERKSVDEPFGAPRTLLVDAAPHRVGMSPDGLRIVYADADGRAFSVVTRDTRDDDFRASEPVEMSLLNGPERALSADELYGDPVISSDDRLLLYSRFGGGRSHTLFLSRRLSADEPWPDGAELATARFFDAVDDDRFQPTGLSSDGKTLFLWHEAELTEYAALFDAARSRFESAVNLGGLSGAMPNADCGRLYFDSAGVSADLFFAATR